MNDRQTKANLVYVGFWMRAWATVIDTVLLTAIILPILIGVYGVAYFDSRTLIHGPIDFIVSWVLPPVAAIVFWVYRSATPGKMAISARIVDADTGNKPSSAQFVGRYFAYLASLLPLGLGFIWIAFDARKQAWHDKLAGTVVVRTPRAVS